MEKIDRKKHWETIYETKDHKDVSWYEDRPEVSLSFFKDVPTSAKIIDIGGGDTFLVDNLLELGYQDITVLDISAAALENAKKRLGDKAKLVKWIVADIANYTSSEQYDVWHDRAAFHFLTNEKEIEHYVSNISGSIADDGILIMGTFSEQGPTMCSAIPIKQYSEESMKECFSKNFEATNCTKVDHKTPFDTVQNFTFCSFRKL